MKYKGYTGTIEVDEESKTLFGRVIGLRDMITFEGQSFPELERAFHDSVDVYLKWCAERGESPEKPFSGRFIVRIEPTLHRQLSDAAEAANLSLNSFIQARLAEELNPKKTEPEKPARKKPKRTGQVLEPLVLHPPNLDPFGKTKKKASNSADSISGKKARPKKHAKKT